MARARPRLASFIVAAWFIGVGLAALKLQERADVRRADVLDAPPPPARVSPRVQELERVRRHVLQHPAFRVDGRGRVVVEGSYWLELYAAERPEGSPPLREPGDLRVGGSARFTPDKDEAGRSIQVVEHPAFTPEFVELLATQRRTGGRVLPEKMPAE